mmetsp:Transcript_13623/g.40479  ORF Transcript_13623/g.40479 Transcript_13623/m.40479 type:complete len:212 (-) Transcript_13623:18-653(-)
MERTRVDPIPGPHGPPGPRRPVRGAPRRRGRGRARRHAGAAARRDLAPDHPAEGRREHCRDAQRCGGGHHEGAAHAQAVVALLDDAHAGEHGQESKLGVEEALRGLQRHVPGRHRAGVRGHVPGRRARRGRHPGARLRGAARQRQVHALEGAAFEEHGGADMFELRARHVCQLVARRGPSEGGLRAVLGEDDCVVVRACICLVLVRQPAAS